MLRPVKLITGLLAFSLFLITCLLISSFPIPSPSSSADTLRFCAPPQSPTHQQHQQQQYHQEQQRSRSNVPVRAPSKVTRQIKHPAVPGKSTAVVFPPASTPVTPTPENPNDKQSPSSPASSFKTTTAFKQLDPQDPRYLMYIPYAGVTNQLISIWHGSLIAKALNRTLLIPNLSPNVHVEVEGQEQEPAPTKWSEFFDLEQYSQLTGLKIEELDTFLARRGIVEKTKRSMTASSTTTGALNSREDNRKRKRSETESVDSSTIVGRKWRLRKRWVQVGSPIQQGHPVAPSPPSTSSSSSSSSSSSPSAYTSGSRASSAPSTRSIKFPTVQKCFSEAGYGSDRRIDMTGRRFMQRYNIDPTLIPTPFLDPDRDNDSIWSRWRMDKVIERYQQPEFEDQEILCLGHVYRLLPGGHNRAWVEFGQHFRYTDQVHAFVDEILNTLLPSTKDTLSTNQESQQQQQEEEEEEQPRHLQPFVGVHLRRGDFQRHCLGITSPADPNGWNRCYPSTEHIISLFNNYSHQQYQHQLQQYRRQQSLSRASPSTLPKDKKLPVLVLTNERDPIELAKADAQNWIRVDHQQLGTLERFGRYGPILIDGALLARANQLIGVEYSTYFKTASKRAENWYGGRTIFVT